MQRFWDRVDRTAGPDGCWLWTGSRMSNGYGDLRTGGKHWLAHRFALSLQEELRSGLDVMHSCDNRLCVNPLHLSQGTRAENLRDMAVKKRSSHGERSHFAKLTADAVRDIRRRIAAGEKQKDVAAELGLHHNTVHYIVQRKTWVHV